MLGGSAPSQTSGAPHTTDSTNRTAPWPPPANQTDICNRGCGIYSLFPEPNEPPGTLFAPASRAPHHGDFKDFVKMQKVSETFFSSKLTFVSGSSPHFQSSSLPEIRTEVAHLNSTQVSKPYGSPEGMAQEQDSWRKCRTKMTNEVILIKTEAEEASRTQMRDKYMVEGQRHTRGDIGGRQKKNRASGSEIEQKTGGCEEVFANEPDSTESKISNEIHLGSDVTTSEVESLEKEAITAGSDADHDRESNSVRYPYSDKVIENGKEKSNIKMIESLNGKKMKKSEKFSVKIESVSDVCNMIAEKKYVNSKTADSNNKNSSALNRKLYNESLKPSPTRTLSLSPQNGGCSRTTPVAFKNLALQETDQRSQSLHVEVPPLLIKREPLDCHKGVNGTPFLSPGPLDGGFFGPENLNVLDGQLLSPMSYSGSFESSGRQKDSFLSPLDQSFYSPGHAFLSPRPVSETSFLSPNLDLTRFGYKNYSPVPKIGTNYMMGGNDERISEGGLLRGGSPIEGRQSEDAVLFINPNVSDGNRRNKVSESSVTPCQVAEVTSASSLLSPKQSSANPLIVKQEAVSAASTTSSAAVASVEPNKEATAFLISNQSTLVSSTVGTASGRQGCHQRLNDVKIPSKNVPVPPVIHKTVRSPSASIDLPPAIGTAVFAGSMMDERSANLITTWPTQTHNPTLWQYSAPIDYPPFPPVGLQLVRDPITGHFLLIPASNLEALQRAILWPNYQTTPPQMIIPPLSVQPSSPHLLLDTNVPAVDYLTSETIHHGAPQHRILITSDDSSKRKVTNPTVVKLENPDYHSNVVVAACDNSIYSKTELGAISSGSESVFHSQRTCATSETGRRSQATSPCLNSSLRSLSIPPNVRDDIADSSQYQKLTAVTLQDASNQTEMPFENEGEECTSSVASKDKFAPYLKTSCQSVNVCKTHDIGTETGTITEPTDDKQFVLRQIHQKKEIEQSLNIVCPNVPDSLNIKKEIVSPSQVDLSGLELLSNSIERFVCDAKCKKFDVETVNCEDDARKDLSNDACEGAVLLQKLRNGFREIEESESYENDPPKNFGGLGLLCALAEQRIREEMGKEIAEEEEEQKNEIPEETKIEEVCSETNLTKSDLYRNIQTDHDELPKLKREVGTHEFEHEDSVSAEEEKSVHCSGEFDADMDRIDASESRLGCEKIFRRGPGRPKKEREPMSSILCKPQNYKEMSPPVLEKQTDLPRNGETDITDESSLTNSKEDILKPPTLTPNATLNPVITTTAGFSPTLELTPCKVNLVSLKIGSSKKKEGIVGESRKRKLSDSISGSSSKKRKVGRPRKNHLLHHDSITETIVAKKPKKKPPFLFRPAQKTIENWNCSKTKNENASLEKSETKNLFVKLDLVRTNVENVMTEEMKKSKKIRPKLKAEPKLKDSTSGGDDENRESKKNTRREDKQKTKVQRKVAIEEKNSAECLRINGTKKLTSPSCVLTTEHLQSDRFPIRTLTAMGGLFYAGQLSAIRPPDVYGITIDGERGNRPHIYSREEILKDSILEVKPESTRHLVPGTRCCAYWSEQYRCLYPGTVSAPVSPDPDLDDKFVNVEFDDGDSGRIDIDDVRMLPDDYPIVEYDPNPLQSLSRKKRRISGTSAESHSKERKSVDLLANAEKSENTGENIPDKAEPPGEDIRKKSIHGYESVSFLSLESERRHLKKKRREKLKRLQSLSLEGKKKHKKHRCCDEHRHHRHHKKHRKHKHKHGKRHISEMNGMNGKAEEEEELALPKKHKSKSKAEERRKNGKPKKCKERTESVESRSKMAAFLPARQLWGWSGKGYKRPGAKGRARKEFYKTIQRGKERITVGDCAVFLSTGRPDRPYIGRIESMWESWGTNMIVRVKWFYHPEETVGCPATLEYPGALFESPHVDENDVQTISHKCEVLPLKEYTAKIGDDPQRYETIYDNNDIYYLAGYYDPTNTTLKMEPGVK